MCISHTPSDRIYYIEYDDKSVRVEEKEIVRASGYSCFSEPGDHVPAHSHCASRLHALPGDGAGTSWSVDQLQLVLRDRDPGQNGEFTSPSLHAARRPPNQVSIVMRPATGEIWTTDGSSAQDSTDRFFRIEFRLLLGSVAVPPRQGDRLVM